MLKGNIRNMYRKIIVIYGIAIAKPPKGGVV